MYIVTTRNTQIFLKLLGLLRWKDDHYGTYSKVQLAPSHDVVQESTFHDNLEKNN